MEWHPVTSSNIDKVAHDEQGLHVQFKGGAHYVYSDAPAHHLEAIKAADSPGKYLREHVQGRHDYKKL
jgi:KTSC domain